MIRLPADMTRDDVAQWIGNAVFLVRTKAGDTPVPCDWGGMQGAKVIAVPFVGPDAGKPVTVSTTHCFAVWPLLGSVNHPRGYAVHLQRVSVRQYKRSFNNGCINVVVPSQYVVGKRLGFTLNELTSWSTVRHLPWENAGYPASVDDLEAMLEAGRPTVALNRRVIVGGSGATEKRMLYLDGILTATYTSGTLFPLAAESEVAALLKYTGGRYGR